MPFADAEDKGDGHEAKVHSIGAVKDDTDAESNEGCSLTSANAEESVENEGKNPS